MDHLNGLEGQVKLAGRVVGSQGSAGYVCQWDTSSRDIGFSHKLCKDLSVTQKSTGVLLQLSISLQRCISRGKMTLGKLLLQCSFSIQLSSGYCIQLIARTPGPQARPLLASLPHGLLASLLPFYRERFYKRL